MKVSAIIILLFSLATFADAASPEVSYSWEGGHSPYKHIGVEIDVNGIVAVTINRYDGTNIAYGTKLNLSEISDLNAAISDSNILNLELPSSDLPVMEDVGRTTITVKNASAQRTLSYTYSPRLKPLEGYLWRLVTQADLSDAAYDNSRVYNLLGSIASGHAAAKVLQPYVFHDSLIESLKTQTNFQQVAWRLEALCCVTAPMEFAGIVSQNLDRSNTNHWRLWLTSLSTPECYNNLQGDHLRALFPLFAEQIRKYGDSAQTLDTPEGEAFYRFRNIMREHNFIIE